MPYGYQYGQSGGLKSVSPGSPYRSIFPHSGTLLLQLLQQKKAQQALEFAERKRGQEIADAAWRDAVKYNPNPARSEYQEYFKKQMAELMDIATRVRRGDLSPDEVYKKLSSIQSDDQKVGQFEKEGMLNYNHLQSSGYRHMGKVNEHWAGSVFNVPLSGQMGVKVVTHPGELDINRQKANINNDPETYSPNRLTEAFIKTNIDPHLRDKFSLTTAPFDKIKGEQSQELPSDLTDGVILPSGKPRIIVGAPGSPNSNKLLAQWESMSPDHAKYLDLMVHKNNPDLNLEGVSPHDLGILKQNELQKILDENGHIDTKSKSQIYSGADGAGTAAERSAAAKEKLLNLKAKVIYDLHTGDRKAVDIALANMTGVGTDGVKQQASYDEDKNEIILKIKGADVVSPWGGVIPGKSTTETIYLGDPKKSVPLINSYWQRVSPVKSEVDTQTLLDEVSKMGINESARVRQQKSVNIDPNNPIKIGPGLKGSQKQKGTEDPLGLFN